MKKIESVFDKLEREGRLHPVPEADLKKFREAMDKVIAEGEEYRRQQAKLIAQARQRIVFA